MVTGAFDWLANGDLFSPGIILVVMLVGCLAVVMFNVIQAKPNCAGVNSKGSRSMLVWPSCKLWSKETTHCRIPGGLVVGTIHIYSTVVIQ